MSNKNATCAKTLHVPDIRPRPKALLTVLLVVTALLSATGTLTAKSFPGGVSPNHVYSSLDLLDRSIDAIYAEQGAELPESPLAIESGLGPLHVYQMLLACLSITQQIDQQVGVMEVPTIIAKPRKYAPRDVKLVADLILSNVRKIGSKTDTKGMPQDVVTFAGKTPTDVFDLLTRIFVKLNRMAGYEKVSPNDVYAQIVRAEEDARSILRQADPTCRYKINAPQSQPGRTPGDAFDKCLSVRQTINKHRSNLGMPLIPVPELPVGYKAKPGDVLFQTQIIIAELNLLKMATGTISSTPLPIPVSGKTPTDVHEQCVMMEYLLEQVDVKTHKDRKGSQTDASRRRSWAASASIK